VSQTNDIIVLETLYDSSVTRVQRCVYNDIPVIIKSTAQDIPDESLIGQYRTSNLAQNKVDHPAVNKVIKEIGEGAGRSLILEDVGGITFKDWIKSTKEESSRWPLEDPAVYHSWMLRLLRWSILLSEGISACHQQNIIHNDINPANVIVNPNTDQVQLIDFGAAFPDGSNIHEWTVVEQHRTLTYISPEQTGRLNRNIDYRSDYYALGATLYQLFSSLPPFIAHDLPELIHCHIARHPVPLDHINPLIPESLSALVEKLMAKAPEDRYQNGHCLIQDLKSIEYALTSGIPFPLSELGRNDVPEQLLIPAKLYGRDKELATLQTALNSNHDKPVLIAVEGEAGGGKTTLITEVILHAVNFSYLLLMGKSDAYNKKPHNALSQALEKSVGFLLSMPEDQFIPWRLTLLEALNYNPHTLISLCPELFAIFESADFSEKIPLHNADIQLKLHTSIFLQHLSALEPILLFIDDVQWCDGPSIALLESVINSDYPRITVLVTCRSEEVDGSHPYSMMKKSIQDSGVVSVVIRLMNLELSQIKKLLVATFHIEKDRLGELANILLKKTLGNPLFVHEFLKAANNSNHRTLYYDNQKGRWEWDTQRLNQIATSGNVAALLIDALHQQEPHAQDLLQWAACIGTRFNEALLVKVAKISIVDIKKHLNAVYKQGYIHRIADQQGNYAFNHDRIRQAYYELLLNESVLQRHWVIGQACTGNEARVGDDPLPHFLIALRDGLHAEMLCDEDTVLQMIDMFYEGALSAKEKTANDIALQYIQCALHILETNEVYDADLLGRLLLLQGELGYLIADIHLGGESFHRYRLMNPNANLQAASFSKQAPLAFMRGDVDGSINFSLSCFRLLGVDTPFFGEDIGIPLDFQRKRFDLLDGEKKVSELSSSNGFNDKYISLLQSTAANMELLLCTKAEYRWAEWFGLVGINDFLVSGFSTSTLQVLAFFNTAMVSLGRYKFGNAMSEETALILKKNDSLEGAGFVFGTLGAYSGRYSYSLSRCISMLSYGAEISLDKGEYLPYLACISNRIVVSFSAGIPLQEVNKLVTEHQSFLVSCGELVSAGKYYSKLLEQLINPASENSLEIGGFTKIQWIALSKSAAFGAYHHLRLQRYFWFNEYSCVVEHYKKEKLELDKLKGMAPMDDNYFIYAISCLQCGDLSGDAVRIAINKIDDLSTVSPSNFRHKSLLIKAEMYRINDDACATDYYNRAAMSAKENGFIQMYALSHEFHARYWKEKGRPDYMRYHVAKAMQGYQRWGCVLKLERLYKEFDQSQDYSSSLSSGVSISKPQLINENSRPIKSPNIQGQKLLLKISNAVTEELNLKQRLLHISQIVVENIEAQRGILLLKVGECFEPKAMAYAINENGKVLYEAIEANDQNILDLPDNMIAKCATSKKIIVVRNDDESISKLNEGFCRSEKIESLLYYPIVYKGFCQSMLVLSHQREGGVTRQDILFLNALSPQLSVSIENARLYQERQQFNSELEGRVDKRTQELQAANEELEAFTASVTHDLKAPLRAISGFTVALSEDYEGCLGSEGKHYLKLLMDASGTMEQIIDGLLTLSRFTQTTLLREEVNVSTLVEDKLRWLRTMEPLHYVQSSIQQGLTVNGDLRLIRRVIDNLLENSWKYSHGVINPSIYFGMTVTDQSSYTFYVRDNGVGFDAANAEELFAPFRRFHSVDEFEGTGVGLATVYRIVRRHGGHVWVQSERGDGATFYFTLNDGSSL